MSRENQCVGNEVPMVSARYVHAHVHMLVHTHVHMQRQGKATVCV